MNRIHRQISGVEPLFLSTSFSRACSLVVAAALIWERVLKIKSLLLYAAAFGLLTTMPALAATLDSRANIYNAGTVIYNGVEPLAIAVSPGDIVTFTSITGFVNCCSGDVQTTPPDGDPGGSNLNSYNGISGIVSPNHMFVQGVFGTAVNLLAPPPAILNFTTGSGIDFTSIAPLLWQSFFVGDGKTSTSATQTFIAPAGATFLYLGIADASGFNGAPGSLDDNTGQFEVSASITPGTSEVPLPAALPLFATGLGVLGLVVRRRKRAAS